MPLPADAATGTLEPTPPRLEGCSPDVAAALDRCLSGAELDVASSLPLWAARGADLDGLLATADHLRHVQVGDVVTFVVNRNINFTNACVQACRFCAFSRHGGSAELYFLPESEVVRRAVEARTLGATEVCIQAGLAPGVDAALYPRLLRAVHEAAPGLHQHAFSPEEVRFSADLAGRDIPDWLAELKDAGVGSLPGTSAEILDDEVRRRIAPGRISTSDWVRVIESAHGLGIPTTCTMMYGHVEDALHRSRHLELLRSIQRHTGGFTEFVPLSFVFQEAPMTLRGKMAGLRAGPDEAEVLATHAIARLMLGRDIPNLQVSWVKEGLARCARLLRCGANDLGGTLMNESISTAAGASHGEFQPPSALRQVARMAGRPAAERTTLYRRVADEGPESTDLAHPLDALATDSSRLGSYRALLDEHRFPYTPPRSSGSSTSQPKVSSTRSA